MKYGDKNSQLLDEMTGRQGLIHKNKKSRL